MFTNNPELKKNLKLECSLTRILIPVLLLLLVSWAGWNSVTTQGWEKRPLEYYKGEALFGWLCGFGFFFTIIWGTYLTASSLHEELRQKTWDFVRLSSLSPAKILVGKLFGSTAIVWGVTLIGALPLMLFAGSCMIPEGGVIRPAADTLTIFAVCLFFWTVLSHALALLIGLAMNSRTRSGTFVGSLPTAIIGLWVGGLLISFFEKFHNVYSVGDLKHTELNGFVLPGGTSYLPKPNTATWYGMELYYLDTLLIGLAFMAVWAVIGAYRALRKSLQHRDAPWGWIGFLVTGSLLLQGFAIEEKNLENVLWGPIMLSVITMIITCPHEAGDLIRYRLLGRHLANGHFNEAFKIVPLWMISFVVFATTTLASILMAGANTKVLMFFFSLLGFIVRDVLVLHTIAWTQNVRRPLLGMALYLLCFYCLLPILVNTVDRNSSYVFYPLVENASTTAYWALLAAQIAAITPFFLKRWGNAFGKASAA